VVVKMSLIVRIISKVKGFDTKELESEIPYPHNDLFGFESWRKTLWGNSLIKDLGCYKIYSLRENDVYVYDDDVIELKGELQKILENIDLISKQTQIEKSSIEFRVKNALETIKIVEKNIEKVGIVLW
jgi:hypothetical protein